MKFGQFMSHYTRKNFIKNSAKTAARKLVPGPFVFAKRIKHMLHWKMKLLKQPTYI